MKRFQKPKDDHRYYDGSVWHPHFIWFPMWVDKNHYEWCCWIWKRHMNIELEHRVTTDFLSRKVLG